MYEIGKRIKMFREQKGLSQKNFAAAIGAKNTTVSNWEKGYTRPDVDTLAKICETLGVSADDMLDIRFNPEDMNSHEKEIIMAYRTKTEVQHAVNILLGLESK
ncbi:MAG: helix-turn-helix domain-containing protein [Chitinispirillales bacterium]|jgi:transcriptional regulator with XRE-family HTH domain|nr:helix-turn-helix domain-containing protein [Chitinispirillales bacterium]